MTKIYQLMIAVSLVFIVFSFCLLAQTDKPIKDDQIVIYTGVRDKYGRPLSGLKQENFKLYEGKKEKPITFFSDENEPASVGFVIDTSGSMTFKKPLPYRNLISGFTNSANAKNEYFAITFSVSAKLTNFSEDSSSFLDGLGLLTESSVPEGDTKLFDAVYLALETMNRAKYKKKTVIVFSDLGENESKIKFDQLKWVLRESNVILYIIGISNDSTQSGFFFPGIRLLKLVDISGGRALFPANAREMEECFERIRLDLQHRYIIGFEPSVSQKKDQDEWRTVKIEVEPPQTFKGKLLVTARDGYYALRK